MIVHFVCSGNAYRSRLAEAYIKSLEIPSITVMSSGARTWLSPYRNTTPYADLLSEKYKIKDYVSKHKNQLTQDRLNSGDVTVVVNRQVYRECQEDSLELPKRTFIWDIEDITNLSASDQAKLSSGIILAPTEKTFLNIKNHVDELVAFLKRPKSTEKIDVLDQNGLPTGETSDINTIHNKGLIHGGIHVGLYTKQGGVVLEKRSSNIIFNPGLWDLSMGGVISSGETPEESLIRETKEELGITLELKDTQKLFVSEYNHYLSHYGFHNHNFIHTYIAEVPEDIKFKLQESEVGDARIVSISEARNMNDSNKAIIGQIIDTHAYYDRILDAIKVKI